MIKRVYDYNASTKLYLPQKRYAQDEMRVVIKITLGERNEQRNQDSDI